MPAETVTEQRPGQEPDKDTDCQKDVNRDAQKIQANVVYFFQTYGAKATTTQNRLIAAEGRDDGQAKARNSQRKM